MALQTVYRNQEMIHKRQHTQPGQEHWGSPKNRQVWLNTEGKFDVASTKI